MPEKLGNGGHGPEDYDANNGQYVEDGVPNKSYDNPDEKTILNSIGLNQNDVTENNVLIPKKPNRPRIENYIGLNGEIDYEKLEKDREEYRKNFELYIKQKNDIIENFYNRKRTINTFEELNQWLEKNNYILGDGTEKLDLKALLDFAEINDYLLKKYPAVENFRKRENWKYKIDFDEINDFMASATSKEGFLGFCFGKFAANYKDFIAKDLENREFNWCVKGNGNIKSLYTHEFGHDLYNSIVVPFYKTYPFLVKEFEKDIINTLNNKKGISDYAKTNPEELFAEAFSEYECGNSEFGDAIAQLLERWLTKK